MFSPDPAVKDQKASSKQKYKDSTEVDELWLEDVHRCFLHCTTEFGKFIIELPSLWSTTGLQYGTGLH